MRLVGDVVRTVSDFRVMVAIALSLSVALPLVMFQTSKWRTEAAFYAGKLENEAAIKAISVRASERIKDWSEAKSRMPIPGDGAPASGSAINRTTQMGVNIENQRTTRVGADRVLEGLAQNTDGLFVPDALLIRATKPGEGIFAKNEAEDFSDALALTIKGEFVSRDIQ